MKWWCVSLEILLKNNVFVYLLILNCSLILYNFINNFGKYNAKQNRQTNRNNNQKKPQKNIQVIEEPRTTKRALIKKIFLNENINIYKMKINYHKELNGFWLILFLSF